MVLIILLIFLANAVIIFLQLNNGIRELGVRVHFLSFFAKPYHAPPAKKDKNTPQGPWCPLGLLTFGLEKL